MTATRIRPGTELGLLGRFPLRRPTREASTMPYRWTFYPEASRDAVRRLMDGLKISPVLARVLGNRGVSTVPIGQRFLSPSIADLHDPLGIPGMDRAVARIGRAIEAGERIGVYGDYDVDGVTGAALLFRF